MYHGAVKTVEPRWLERPAFILFLFCLLIFIVRIFFRGYVLEMDEAEQMVMAQQLLPGYPEQPPLYSWLQYGVFSLVGHNLAGLALLKSLLFFGCLYCYHQICRLYCQSSALAWCATLAWVLFPTISLDLIKDNTHSILALFAACLTWYWFVAPSRLSKSLWYLIFGCIIGIGLLSKFNYLLFLAILIISATLSQEYRAKFFSSGMLLTFLVAFIIASPYVVWLLTNHDTGLHSSYKLVSSNKQPWHGLGKLIKATLVFVSPLLIISWLALPIWRREFEQKPRDTLLTHFQLLCLPVLSVVVLGGISNFATRWLIPLFFLTPVFYFSRVKARGAITLRIKVFLLFCVLVQLSFLCTLIYRNHVGNNLHAHIPLQYVIDTLKKAQKQTDYLVSDSYWLLGNLMLNLSINKGWLMHPAKFPKLPQGNLLVIWQASNPPPWVNYLTYTEKLREIKTIEEPQNNRVIVGYVYHHSMLG